MSKTELTRQVESALWRHNNEQGTFGCFEVTIGWFGKEIVDFITYKTNGEFRCYEIKVSVSDFNSKANLSFCGDFNYYVIPNCLLDDLRKDTAKRFGKDDLTLFDKRIKNSGIGLVTVSEQGDLDCLIKAKRKPVNHGTRATLLESMVRSLNREVKKFYVNEPYWKIKEGAAHEQ